MLFLTIPADKGWTVLVDDAAQPIESIAGGFIGVTIPPGTAYGNQAVFLRHKDNAREVNS